VRPSGESLRNMAHSRLRVAISFHHAYFFFLIEGSILSGDTGFCVISIINTAGDMAPRHALSSGRLYLIAFTLDYLRIFFGKRKTEICTKYTLQAV